MLLAALKEERKENDMYTVTYSKFVKAHLVIDTDTKLAQSSWSNRLDALVTARDLNLKNKIKAIDSLNNAWSNAKRKGVI